MKQFFERAVFTAIIAVVCNSMFPSIVFAGDELTDIVIGEHRSRLRIPINSGRIFELVINLSSSLLCTYLQLFFVQQFLQM